MLKLNFGIEIMFNKRVSLIAIVFGYNLYDISLSVEAVKRQL